MRKKYLSALLFGALVFASAGTFTSCKDYDDDIENLQTQIDKVVSDLASLKSTVDNLKVGVTSVTVNGDQLVVVTDGATTKMNLPAGVQVSEIEIKNGHLYVGGVDKGAIACESEKAQKVEVKDGYLYIDDVKQTLVDKVGSSVVIKDASNGVYTITIDGQTIQLPMAEAFTSLTSVEFVKNAADEDITFGGIYQDSVPVVEAIEWNKAAINHPDWKGPKGAVTRNQLLVGQTSAINVQVTPASYALGSQKLTLVDTKGNVAPAKISATENTVLWWESGRAANNASGSWNLAVEMDETVTPENIASAFSVDPANTTDKRLYALAVNGQIVTGYDIVVKTNATPTSAAIGASSTLGANTADLVYVDNNGVVKQLSTDKLPMGTTDLTLWLSTTDADNNRVYDSYITFEGTNISLAAAKGIKANGMTITAPATAAGTTITATVYVMDITGYVWKKNVTIKVATSAAQNLTISTTNYVVKPAATEVALVSQSIKIDMENIFASIDAATLEQARRAGQVAVKEAASQTGFFLAPTTLGTEENIFASPVYLKADNTRWSVTRDDLLELKYIQLNIGTTPGKYLIAKDAKPGSYELAFVVLQDNTSTTQDNEIIRIKMPVEVKTPAFTDMFDKNYTTDSFEARIQPVDDFATPWTAPLTKYQARLSMTPAFKVQPAYSANVDMLAFQFEKIGNDAATGDAIYPAVNLVAAYNSEIHDTSIDGFVDLNKKEIYNATGNDLSVTAISNTVAHYSVLDKLTATYAEAAADLEDLKEAFMVSSAQFDTKIVKALDGLKLNSDANTVYTLGSDGIIKVGSDLLKLVWGSENKDIKLSGNDILNAATLGGYNFVNNVNFGVTGNRLKVRSKIEITNHSAGSTVTAAVTATGVTVTGLTAGETATVHFIFTDATGIQYKLSVRVKQG